MARQRAPEGLGDPADGLVVAVVGIDGCGKSSTVGGALEHLAGEMRVASVGDRVTVGGPDDELRERHDIPLSRSARAVGAMAKGLRQPDLYKNLKLLEFAERTHIRNYLLAHRPPAAILCDGDPLVNVSAWAAAKYLRDELAGDDERLFDLIHFMAGTRPIPWRQLPYYLRHAWHLAFANRLHVSPFPTPDRVVLLEIAPAVALDRIRARGRPLQAHETEAFLADLADGYDRVCALLATRFAVEVVRLRVDELGFDETVRSVVETVRTGVAERRDHPTRGPIDAEGIEVIATTISGSFADQKKVEHIEPTFREATDRPVHLHVADSHREAQRLARDIVEGGGRTIVSAGGAGTMNAVLEGCHVDGSLPAGLRLAFMRKGSADLIGKALHVPDDLAEGAVAISASIAASRLVPADVLSIDTVDADGRTQLKHMLGFGGIGVFGDVPRFTENRLIKYYKGLLGTLLGDLGPFYVGLALAAVTWSARCIVGRVPKLELQLDAENLAASRWVSVIFLNGDLGKDFPLGRGLPFHGDNFRVVVLRHRGVRSMLRQVVGSRNGALLEEPERYDAIVRDASTFVARPIGRPLSFMVNVDGLRLRTDGTVRVAVSGQVMLVDATRDEKPTPVEEPVVEMI